MADGAFTIEQLQSPDITRAAVLLSDYADLPLGFVDATVLATAERMGTAEIRTTDRRHFGVLRPHHTRALVLSP